MRTNSLLLRLHPLTERGTCRKTFSRQWLLTALKHESPTGFSDCPLLLAWISLLTEPQMPSLNRSTQKSKHSGRLWEGWQISGSFCSDLQNYMLKTPYVYRVSHQQQLNTLVKEKGQFPHELTFISFTICLYYDLSSLLFSFELNFQNLADSRFILL